MNKYCDLHVHSSLSDGDFTQKEVIELAISNGITILAITDHNIAFVNRKNLQAEYPNIKLISGTEVSTKIFVNGNKYKEIHVIALDYDESNYEFLSFLSGNRINNRFYIESVIKWLNSQGIYIDETYDSLKSKTKSEHIGRLMIAKLMVEKGLCKSIDEAFDVYIGNKPDNDCPKPSIELYADLPIAVSKIVNAGGIPVLAHPLLYSLSDNDLRNLLEEFRKLGGKGIEVYYGSYNESERKYLLQLANDYNLIPSAASDFHGHGHSGLDNRFPESIAQRLLSCNNPHSKM